MDAYCHSPCVIYDPAWSCPVLRWLGAVQKCAFRADALLRHRLPRLDYLVCGWVQSCPYPGNEDGWIGGQTAFFLQNLSIDSLNGDHPETVWIMFQMTFAIITPGLIVGAFVERIKFSAVLLFSAIWLVVVYCPVCYWVWGGSWLASRVMSTLPEGLWSMPLPVPLP